MTPLGFLCLILAIPAILIQPGIGLFVLLIFTSIFQAGAIINIPIGASYIGIMPYYAVALLLCIRMTFVLISQKYAFSDPSGFISPLLAFVIWSVISAFFLPHLFSGTLVYDPRGGIDSQVDTQTPLAYSFSNIGQAGYLIINFLILVYVNWKAWDWDSLQKCIKALHVASFVVVLVGLYQVVAFWKELPFPDWFFNSNLGARQLAVYTLEGVGRINSTFSEASILASYLASYIAFLVVLALGKQLGLLGFFMLVLSTICILLSTSSTGYVVLLILAIMVLFQFLLVPLVTRASLTKLSMVQSTLILILVMASVITIGIAYNAGYGEALYKATIGKADTGSYANRGSSNWFTLNILLETWGFGVGLGSNRPSSFLAWLASNVGILGLILFIMAYAKLLLVNKNIKQLLSDRRERITLLALQWGLATHLIAKLISLPDLALPNLWIWTILVLICLKATSSRGIVSEAVLQYRQKRLQPYLLKH